MESSGKPTVGDLLHLVEAKRSAHHRLVSQLPEGELRQAVRTGIHIDREEGVIRLAVVKATVERLPGWSVREDIPPVPLSEYPTLAVSQIRGFIAV